ncbi:hypothetical protein [Pendulispora albinea]|uniref:DUF4276 family protein n=1 Tax=Pendulispora albinea TaxID=2741071 RepID=A0ABZ2M0L7_9BACT
MKVLVIPEDQELDRYIVKPVVEAMFQDLEIRARIDVLPEPRLRGSSDALDPTMIADIIRNNPMIDLFLLVVDRDCDRASNTAKALARQAEHPGRLVACVAIQEIEVWMLALYKDTLSVPFTTVRAECDPKELWAALLLKELGGDGPGRGRKKAMRKISGAWRSLRDTCVELRDFEDTVRAWYMANRS